MIFYIENLMYDDHMYVIIKSKVHLVLLTQE